ncbi:MAG TPA: hypothetical protein VMF89_33760 [Polyangiales bacterium]|nr:hypothetical protein [Polyangiales bacterium]
MRLVAGIVLAVVSGFVLYKGAGCVWPHGCTEASCSDYVAIDLAFADHRWPDGAYKLEVQFEDAQHKHTCAFSWPEAQPARGSSTVVPCEPSDLEASLLQDTKCMEQRTSDAVSQSCVPLEGQYTLRLSLFATPPGVALHVTRDGEPLKDVSFDLEYAEERPNGPDCDPLCHESSQELQLD